MKRTQRGIQQCGTTSPIYPPNLLVVHEGATWGTRRTQALVRRQASLRKPRRMRSGDTGIGRILFSLRLSKSALFEGSSRSSRASVAASEEEEAVARTCHRQHESTTSGNTAPRTRGQQPAGEPFCRASIRQGTTLPHAFQRHENPRGPAHAKLAVHATGGMEHALWHVCRSMSAHTALLELSAGALQQQGFMPCLYPAFPRLVFSGVRPVPQKKERTSSPRVLFGLMIPEANRSGL